MTEKIIARTRFAPSPTGYLHIGSARTALFCWLFARKNQGSMILRIEDTDTERNKEEYVDSICNGLKWLNIEWDEGIIKGGEYGPYRQSERLDIYKKAAEQLVAQGDAYYCYCTPEELEQRRKDTQEQGGAVKYDGKCRNLTEEQKQLMISEGRKPAIRFKMPNQDFVVNDIIRGETIFKAEMLGDFVIMKSDGVPTYQLANVVDDAMMKVTHVIRGEDILPSTPRQMAIYKALGKDIPQFAHLPMILAPDRSKLSKRHGAVSVTEYQNMGYLPEAIINYLALLGWSPPDGEELMTIEKMVANFSLERVNKSGAIFDYTKLKFINSQKIKGLPMDDLKERARKFFPPEELPADEKVYEALIKLTKERVTLLSDFPPESKRIISDPEYTPEAMKDLPASDICVKVMDSFEKIASEKNTLDEQALKDLFKDMQKETGIKGKDLFLPVRVSVTGEAHGPDMVGVIAVIGKEATLMRIVKFKEFLKNQM